MARRRYRAKAGSRPLGSPSFPLSNLMTQGLDPGIGRGWMWLEVLTHSWSPHIFPTAKTTRIFYVERYRCAFVSDSCGKCRNICVHSPLPRSMDEGPASHPASLMTCRMR